jgi:hypothetical protein
MQGPREYFLYAVVYIQVYSLNILRHKWSDFFRIFFTDLNVILLHRFWIPMKCRCPENGKFYFIPSLRNPPPPLSEGCVMLVAAETEE